MSLADQLVRLSARQMGRRGFLGKSAVVGSAMVVAPRDLVLRPQTAYAAICGKSLCSTGYTEFCCTITGVNACPPGTVTGGWWKVDGSQFCGGGARYYLDCNAQCGTCGCGGRGLCGGECSGTGCGCANGDCNNWRSGCNKFRYGQCNQDIPCLVPIVCRVGTCTPPWLFDPSCGTTSRTDENTRNHTRPCAESSFGAVDVVEASGTELIVQGWAFNQDDYVESTLVRVYLDGAIWSDADANQIREDVGAMYPAFGSAHGFSIRQYVAPGKHSVCVYAIDRSSGRGSFLAFREFEVPEPPLAEASELTDSGEGAPQ